MRILHVVHQFLPEHVGGTELYTKTLAEYQSARGDEVAIFFPAGQEQSGKLSSGITIYGIGVGNQARSRVFFNSFGHRTLIERFRRILQIEKPDVVHIQHLMGLPAGIVDVIAQAGIPIVLTLHDYWFPCANAQLVTNYDGSVCSGPDRVWWNCARCAAVRSGRGFAQLITPALTPLMAYRSRLVKRAMTKAQAVIAPTQFVRDIYAQLGMPVDKIQVVPHGIEVPEHVLAAKKRVASRPGPLHIIYVGSIAWQKGLHVLIEAVNQLPHDKVKLSIFGGLDGFPDYVAQLQELINHPHISLPGRINRTDLWHLLLSEADVAVLPTLWYEVSPLTIDEMFAGGVPIVASEIGAMPEKIRDGVDGLLFPAGSANDLHNQLTRLLDEPELLPRLRANIQPVRTMQEHLADIDIIYEQLPGTLKVPGS